MKGHSEAAPYVSCDAVNRVAFLHEDQWAGGFWSIRLNKHVARNTALAASHPAL